MRWALRRPNCRTPPRQGSRVFFPPDFTAIWVGSPTRPSAAPIRGRSGRRRARSSFSASTMGRRRIPAEPRATALWAISRSMPAIATITMSSKRSSRRSAAGWARPIAARSSFSSIPPPSWRNRWPRPPVSAGRASIPIWSHASSDLGCSWARSSRISNSRPTPPISTIAVNAAAVSTSVPPRRFPPPTGSMPAGASPISPSSIRGRSTEACARSWATGSLAATIAWRSVRGTNSPGRRGSRRSRRGPI